MTSLGVLRNLNIHLFEKCAFKVWQNKETLQFVRPHRGTAHGMADSVQWHGQSDCNICISLLVEFTNKNTFEEGCLLEGGCYVESLQ